MTVADISCKVLPGLFENEYYVLVNGSSAYYVNRVNVTVPTDPQENTPVIGTVQGYIVEEADDKTLIQLPGEAVVGGLRTWVEREAVRPRR